MDWAEIVVRCLGFILAMVCINRAMIKIKQRTYDDPMFAVWVISGIGFITSYVKMALF